ncbi:hypothetical protein [Marinicellulosiphila megalodicopiae]|uniref:hypothetical protein n=1 Tax=Marinicellulosiphila megalodicopiae TaxID=2724896 RepID=UPI003BB16086
MSWPPSEDDTSIGVGIEAADDALKAQIEVFGSWFSWKPKGQTDEFRCIGIFKEQTATFDNDGIFERYAPSITLRNLDCVNQYGEIKKGDRFTDKNNKMFEVRKAPDIGSDGRVKLILMGV